MTKHDEEIAESLLCPSAPATEGALILGVVRADGTIGYIKDRMAATSEFLESARAHGRPEQRFRFSSPCQECACQQWADGACSVPEKLAELVPSDTSEGLPRCSIRRHCRWYHQSGAAACRICPLVTRDPPEE